MPQQMILIGAAGLLVVLTCLPAAEAATTGYGAAGAVPFAGVCWTGFTLVNVNTSDDAWATCTAGTNNGRLSTFGFVIPPSATITGIEVEVEGNEGTGVTPVTYTVQLSWDNNTTWTTAKSSTFTGTADATTVLGGPADDWGHAPWSIAELSDAMFQVRIRRSSGGDLRVDRIRVRVHYTVAASTGLYRSVGITATNLNTSARTVEIAGSTATFSDSMPANVGVGDVLQYQVAATYYLAFISGRTSGTVYTVQSSTGGTPQAAAATTAVNVYRAYTSLSNWQAQDENDTIDDTVEDFDTSRDLVTPNVVMNVACYGDGADTTAVTVDGWTTAATNDIRIFTPVRPSEVGTSQRHPGKWDTSKYLLQATPAFDFTVLLIRTSYARVEGLQVWMMTDQPSRGGIGFKKTSDTGVSDYEVSGNIVRGNGAGIQDIRIGINLWDSGSGVLKVWNNVVYDFAGGASRGLRTSDDPDFTFYLYNNTVVDCRTASTCRGTVSRRTTSSTTAPTTTTGRPRGPASTPPAPTTSPGPRSRTRRARIPVMRPSSPSSTPPRTTSISPRPTRGPRARAPTCRPTPTWPSRSMWTAGPVRLPGTSGRTSRGPERSRAAWLPASPGTTRPGRTARRSSSTTPRWSGTSSTSRCSSPAAPTPT
jgi:hypothetical protein